MHLGTNVTYFRARVRKITVAEMAGMQHAWEVKGRFGPFPGISG